MPHIFYGETEKSAHTSDDGWYPVAAQVGKHANNRSGRTDIISVLGTRAGGGAPACFYPGLAELHINTAACPMGDPEDVDFSDRLWMLDHAGAVGAVEHEAAHARHTKWDPADLMGLYGASEKMVDVITTLEEPRIEAHAFREHPDSKPFLRGVALDIVMKDFVIRDTPYAAAAAAGLLLARVDAKTVTRREVRGFRKEIVAVLGEDVLGALEPLWQRFLRLHDSDFEGMVQIAVEWLDVLGEDPEDSDPESMVGGAMRGEPSDGEGEGDGDGEGDKDGAAFGKAIKAKARVAGTKVDTEIVMARGDEADEREAAEGRADADRRKEGDKEHDKAFPPSHGFSPDGFAHYSHSRQPTDDEHTAARSLARTLEQIDFRDRVVTKVSSVLPPGRLMGRADVVAGIYEERGIDTDVPVWRSKRRMRVESPKLKMGFMVDISGSMSSAMEPLASAQWVTTTAGAHVDAEVASVHFGSRIHGVTPNGYREHDVRLFVPADGSEAFRAGALAIDRELNLLDGRGARVLFVASDGCFVSGPDMAYANTFMPLAERKGVAVFFLRFTSSIGAGAAGATVLDCRGLDPADVAALCGRAAIAELRKLDRG